jgi:O-antigen/teichoic acid export membrane protein
LGWVAFRLSATDLKNGPRELGTLYLASAILAIVLGVIAIIAAYIYAGLQLNESGLRGEFILSACGLTAAFLVGYGYAAAGAGFKAYEKLYIEAVLLVFQAILSTAVYWFGTGHHWPLSRFFLALFAATTVHTIISYFVLAAFIVKPEFHLDFTAAWELFRESLQLGYASLLRTLQDRIHPFLINIPSLAGHSYVTQWSSPNNLFMQFKFIPLSIRPALFPTLARKAEDPSEQFQTYSLALMKFLYLLALPLLIMVAVARYEILPLVTSMDPTFKRTYASALQVVPLVAWAVALSFPSQVLRSLFVALRRMEFEFRTVLTGVIVLVVLDIALIPHFKVMGAGFSAIVAELTILMYGLWLLKKVDRGLNFLNLFLLPTLCGIITHLLAEYLYKKLWIYGLLGVIVVFPLLVMIFRVISPVEWSILRELVRPSRSAAK